MYMFCRLKSETEQLHKEKKRVSKKLEKHTIYHKYLDRVLESAEEFHEIREIIARYDTLVATHQVQLFCLRYVTHKDIYIPQELPLQMCHK